MLVDDSFEYDVLTPQGDKISVKCRKGFGNGWRATSAIPKIELSEDAPTHLMFVHLNNDYSIDRIWLYCWAELLEEGRFQVHHVRGDRRSYRFQVNEKTDIKNLLIFK